MKILVDQNISFRIIPLIQPAFSKIEHVKELGLIDINDFDIFMFARKSDFEAILTLDEDFYNIQLIKGVPPKIIWLRTGNCSTQSLAALILKNYNIIHDFLSADSWDCLEIFK